MRRTAFWRASDPAITKMLRVEDEDRLRVHYADAFVVVIVTAGAFDGWYRGRIRSHAPGTLKLKEPGEVHREVRIHAPFTMQGAVIALPAIEEAAASLEVRGPASFRAEPTRRAIQLAYAMHAALGDPTVSALARSTVIAETLAELIAPEPIGGERRRPSRAVRLARARLHDALADGVTLDELAAHAGVDKFRLVRAFRDEVGLPPYAYLTHARVAQAKVLLERGVRVAEAAQTVGFCDESQLHRHFRKIVGVAPGRYARELRATTPNSFEASARRLGA